MAKKVPLYAQLESLILRKIESGEYRYGQPIPSERELSEVYGISRLTVRQALSNLVEQGVVVKIPRKGVFIDLPKVKRTVGQTNSFSIMLKEQGLKHHDETIYTGKVQAGYQMAKKLEIEKGEWFYRICRLRYGDDRPISFEDAFVPLDLIDNIEQVDFGASSLYELYAVHNISICRCEQKISAVKLSVFNAELLNLPPGSPAYKSEFRTYDENEKLVEYTVSYNHPNVYLCTAN